MEHTAEQKIKELLTFAKTHGLAEMVWQENGLRIAFRRNTSLKPKSNQTPLPKSLQNGQQKAAPVEQAEQDVLITSPLVGTFRRSPSKDHPPMVLEGSRVKPGDRVGVVECMKIPTDVVSFSEGFISRVLIEDGQVVEYGQPLFGLSFSKPSSPNGKK